MFYNNILLIDDNADDQQMFSDALTSVTNQVNLIVLSDAELALKKLEENEVQADLIFLDLKMPGMTGQQFLTALKIKHSLKEIPVIIFSTVVNAAIIHETTRLGALLVIPKPDKFGELKKYFILFYFSIRTPDGKLNDTVLRVMNYKTNAWNLSN